MTRQPIVLNPWDALNRGNEPTALEFRFGPYGDTHLVVVAMSLEDGLELCAEWLAEHEPGQLISHDEEWSEDELDSDGQPLDCTYTEAGYLRSWEWSVDDVTDIDSVVDDAIRQLWAEGVLCPYFERTDILAAWNLWLQHTWCGQGSKEYVRHCRLTKYFTPSRSEQYVWGLGENALAIYARLLCGGES